MVDVRPSQILSTVGALGTYGQMYEFLVHLSHYLKPNFRDYLKPFRMIQLDDLKPLVNSKLDLKSVIQAPRVPHLASSLLIPSISILSSENHCPDTRIRQRQNQSTPESVNAKKLPCI